MPSIVWLPSAKNTYAEILENMEIDPALHLDEQVENLIAKLQTFSQLCPTYKNNSNFRKCTINKNISLMYSTDQKTVYLIAFFYHKANSSF